MYCTSGYEFKRPVSITHCLNSRGGRILLFDNNDVISQMRTKTDKLEGGVGGGSEKKTGPVFSEWKPNNNRG